MPSSSASLRRWPSARLTTSFPERRSSRQIVTASTPSCRTRSRSSSPPPLTKEQLAGLIQFAALAPSGSFLAEALMPRRQEHHQAFRDERRRIVAVGRLVFCRARRVRIDHRAFRLRLVDALQHHRRADRRLRGPRRGRGCDRRRHASRDRHGVPGGIDVSVAHRRGERRVSARDRGNGEGGTDGAGRAFRHPRRSLGLRAPLPGGAFRRHAAARGHCAHARFRAAHSADGRAVRRARRAARTAGRQGAADQQASGKCSSRTT